MGRTTQGGEFERAGALYNPRLELLTALGALESEHDLNGSKIPKYLKEMGEIWPSLVLMYLRSDTLKDVLYRADYGHAKMTSADKDAVPNNAEHESYRYCDPTKVVKRKPREMRVHYGLIASGNQVIKDAKFRNKLNKDLGGKILCFEMEAAEILIRCLHRHTRNLLLCRFAQEYNMARACPSRSRSICKRISLSTGATGCGGNAGCKWYLIHLGLPCII